MNYKKLDDLTTQNAATAQSIKRFQANRNRDWGLLGHDTGIHDLNMAIGGWVPGKLTTIAARSGTGKTSITVPFFDKGGQTVNGARAEFLFFTWEMSPDYLVDRHICHVAEVENRLLTQGAKLLTDSKLAKVRDAYEKARVLPVTYQEMATDIGEVQLLYSQFADRCREKGRIEGVDILPVAVIDYVNMAMFDGAGLRTYGIQDFMNGCKKMANKERGSVVVLAQINRTADDKGIPGRSDLSDSQHIENASDNLIILYRPEHHGVKEIVNPLTGQEVDARHKMLMRVVKQREFGTGDILMNCDMRYHQYWALTDDRHYDYASQYSDAKFWKSHFKLEQQQKPAEQDAMKLFDEAIGASAVA